MENLEEFNSLAEAGRYARVGAQAIYNAIKKGSLKATKKPGNFRNHWTILRKDLDEYRARKYSTDKISRGGEKVFDIENGSWSVFHAAKVLSEMLGRHFPTVTLYNWLHIGKLRATKKGHYWIISKEEVVRIYEKESGIKKDQMEMV